MRKIFHEVFHKLIFFVLVCRPMKQEKARTRILDFFNIVDYSR